MVSIRFYFLFLFVLVMCSGCETVAYYNQALKGQLEIIKKQRPLAELIENENTSAELKNKLQKILEILDFADQQLHLPVGGNFSHYVELGRPFVVWNVFAAGELSFDSKSWCYPVVGCASYRGYFQQYKANAYAGTLREDGGDIYVGGVSAYSTLGWLDDPVLSTFVWRNDKQLPALIFHELAHRILYVRDDTEFNESFASTVEQIALEKWLSNKNNPQAFEVYLKYKQNHDDFVVFVLSWKSRLDNMYRSDLSDNEKRAHKEKLYSAMVEDYEVFKDKHNNYKAYDNWMGDTLNNAKLNTLSTYQARVPAFLALYKHHNDDFKKFVAACIRLSQQKKTIRDQQLDGFMINIPKG